MPCVERYEHSWAVTLPVSAAFDDDGADVHAAFAHSLLRAESVMTASNAAAHSRLRQRLTNIRLQIQTLRVRSDDIAYVGS